MLKILISQFINLCYCWPCKILMHAQPFMVYDVNGIINSLIVNRVKWEVPCTNVYMYQIALSWSNELSYAALIDFISR